MEKGLGMYLGIDIGSVSIKAVLIDEKVNIVDKLYSKISGEPLQKSLEIICRFLEKYPSVKCIATTGSGGKLIAELVNGYFVNEIIAQATATKVLHPDVRTVIEFGGENSKMILLGERPLGSGGEAHILRFSTNSVCAAGTGSFLDQQASRLKISIDEFSELALSSRSPAQIAGRCSVFAKTDMIHHQQIGTPICDIIAGLCLACVRNFKSTVVKGEKLRKLVSFQGGVAGNKGMKNAILKVFSLEPDELIVPTYFAFMGAIGAAYIAMNRNIQLNFKFPSEINETNIKNQKPKTWGKRLEGDDYVINVKPVHLEKANGGLIEAFVGVDVGSISTNVVVIDKSGRVLSRRYLLTEGRPIEAVIKGLYEVGLEVKDRVVVKAAGTTGSGRYMTGKFIGADVIKNEITSHAKGAVLMDEDVDTIFEIGGQDAKYISLEHGVIVDFAMNKVCAAGTGSFLEEQAEKLNVDIKGEFEKLALNSKEPVNLGERCTVFVESQLNYYQQNGVAKEDLLSGLAYAVVENYLNKVVEKRRIGEKILFQGGVAYNRAVKAAFESILGKKVYVPPHHDILGAIGVALIARDEYYSNKNLWQTNFKGFDLRNRKYKTDSFTCKRCPNSCEIRRVLFDDKEMFLYGARCSEMDISNQRSNIKNQKSQFPDLWAEREEVFFQVKNQILKTKNPTKRSIGIPRAGMFFELFPLWETFFSALGFEVIVSDPTNKRIIQEAVESVPTEPCFPIKVAYGHVLNLIKKKVDYLFLPSVVSMPPLIDGFDNSYNCPYVQSLPYILKSSIDFSKQPHLRVLTPIFHMDRPWREIYDVFRKIAYELGISSKEEVLLATKYALEAQKSFDNWMRRKGKEILDKLDRTEQAAIIIGRAYNIYDSGISLALPEKLRSLGILPIPIDFLPLEEKASDLLDDFSHMYWKSGQKILSAAKFISGDERLFAVYITNFGCGPDSYITNFFSQEMKGKPFLILEIDEHTSDVGILTRCEAFLDTIKQIKKRANITKGKQYISINRTSSQRQNDGRVIYIPYMDDHGYVVCSALKLSGIPAEALPVSDEESLELGRKFTSGKECFPSIITTGDILKKALSKDFIPDKSAFFMPSANGPCRFGLYHRLHRMILDRLGFKETQIINFDQCSNYHRDSSRLVSTEVRRLVWKGLVIVDYMQKLLRKIRAYESNKGSADLIYKEGIDELQKTITEGKSIEAFAVKIIKRFKSIKVDMKEKKPKIGIVGEIFVRSNPFANNYLVHKLTSLGVEVDLPPVGEWLGYIDYLRTRDYIAMKNIYGLIIQKLTEIVQRYDTYKITNCLGNCWSHYDLFKEVSTRELLRIAEPYINEAVEGEAILSIARSLEYIKKGFSGIINVMPFGCMPGTIVSTILKKICTKHNIPYITLAFDGIKGAFEDICLEAFVQQAKLKPI